MSKEPWTKENRRTSHAKTQKHPTMLRFHWFDTDKLPSTRENEADIMTGAGAGRASYDKLEILDFILDGRPLKRKGIHSTLQQLFTEHLLCARH